MSDALESITHSLCTLEFADHRPLYDWVIDNIKPSGLLKNKEIEFRPTQTEFSRLNLQYTVLSKRKLIQLVTDKHVSGWDDPRMPTICGVRRRGNCAFYVDITFVFALIFIGRKLVLWSENLVSS